MPPAIAVVPPPIVAPVRPANVEPVAPVKPPRRPVRPGKPTVDAANPMTGAAAANKPRSPPPAKVPELIISPVLGFTVCQLAGLFGSTLVS